MYSPTSGKSYMADYVGLGYSFDKHRSQFRFILSSKKPRGAIISVTLTHSSNREWKFTRIIMLHQTAP